MGYHDTYETCIDCDKTKTTNRVDGDPVCATCSNERYSKKIQSGDFVVLKLDMTKVKQSTLLHIQALIQADIEQS
jgi:hypothetical protein